MVKLDKGDVDQYSAAMDDVFLVEDDDQNQGMG